MTDDVIVIDTGDPADPNATSSPTYSLSGSTLTSNSGTISTVASVASGGWSYVVMDTDVATTIQLNDYDIVNQNYNMLMIEHEDGRTEKIKIFPNTRVKFSIEEEKPIDPATAYLRAMSLIGG